MKMSDEINLPVSVDWGVVDAGGITLVRSECEAAAHAINSHDALVEGIELAISDMETWLSVYGASDPTEKLITKLKGLIRDD